MLSVQALLQQLVLSSGPLSFGKLFVLTEAVPVISSQTSGDATKTSIPHSLLMTISITTIKAQSEYTMGPLLSGMLHTALPVTFILLPVSHFSGISVIPTMTIYCIDPIDLKSSFLYAASPVQY